MEQEQPLSLLSTSPEEQQNLVRNIQALAQLYIRDANSTETPSSASSVSLYSTPNSSKKSMRCGFCKQNGDTPEFYTSHNLKDSNGDVSCPILQKHVCELCHATGTKAHTRSYCPIAASGREVFKGDKWSSEYHNMTALKKTSRDSAGKRRPRRR